MIVKPKLILNKFTGMNGGNGMYYLDGCIDDLILESRVWTASEIKKYYTFSLGRF